MELFHFRKRRTAYSHSLEHGINLPKFLQKTEFRRAHKSKRVIFHFSGKTADEYLREVILLIKNTEKREEILHAYSLLLFIYLFFENLGQSFAD